MLRKHISWTRALLAWLTLSFTAAASAQSLVIFGDSLSDTGNRHSVSGMLSVPPYDMLNERRIPSDPYSRGGIHYTNGRTWIEHVAAALGSAGNARPAGKSEGQAANYAWGGSRAYPDSGLEDLPQQVATYLADVNNNVSEETLYVFFIGGNDVMAALQILESDPTAIPAAAGRMAAAVVSVQQSIQTLRTLNARRFLILSAPNVGLVPALDGTPAQLAGCFAQVFNTGGCPLGIALPISLEAIVAGLDADPAVDATYVDVFSFISGVAAQPEMFGLTNVTDACVTPDVPPYACGNPGEYLFWDGIHPTRTVHRLLAGRVLAALDQ
jgi:outer membrane lipase/esterase